MMKPSTFALGIDMGGTKVATGLVSKDGRIVAETFGANRKDSPQTILECLSAQIDQVIEKIGISSADIAGIGLSIPAVMDRDEGAIEWAPNIPALNGFPLRDALQECIGLPVYLGFDGHLAALGEHWVGAGKYVQNMILLIIGTGVGGAIVADGRLIIGSTGLAGAFGWMVHGHEHHRQRELGWLEGQTAGPWILELANTRGQFATTAEVFACAAAGNLAAIEVIEHVGRLLGMAISSLVSALDTELVVLTGGVGSNGELLIPIISQYVREYSQPYIAKKASVIVSELGADAAIVGAAKLAFDAGSVNK
jgi:glucokinase